MKMNPKTILRYWIDSFYNKPREILIFIFFFSIQEQEALALKEALEFK
jgi:hypothetical protein